VVYVGGSDGVFYAFDAQTGAERWKFKMAGAPLFSTRQRAKGYHSPCSAAAPTIKEGILYTGAGGYVYALDLRTGRPKWQGTVRNARQTFGSPMPVYGAVFVKVGGNGPDCGLLALHGENGQVLTVYPNYFWGAFTTMSFAQGTMYATGDAGLTWVDMRSGSRSGTSNTYPDYCTPVIYNDRVITAAVVLVAVDIRTGRRLYEPVIAGGNVRDRAEEAALSARCDAQIAVWKDMVFLSTRDGYCRAFGTNKGARLWKTKLSERSRASVSVSTAPGGNSSEAIVYTGCDDGKVWALNAVDGKVLWNLKVAEGKIMGDPWISESTLFVTSDDGYVYALGTEEPKKP
jgi:outer membrane protein assembly factor BamB